MHRLAIDECEHKEGMTNCELRTNLNFSATTAGLDPMRSHASWAPVWATEHTDHTSCELTVESVELLCDKILNVSKQ